MNTTRHPSRFRRIGTLILTASVITLTSCGQDDVAVSDTTNVIDTTDATDTTEGSDTTVPGASSIDVALADFEFVGVPEHVTPGTEIHVHNQSSSELHELVAVRLADDDDRNVSDIVTGDLGQVLAAAPPALVILATPGGTTDIVAVGDGILHEAGRYLLLCTIPTGVDPQEYLDAAAAAGGQQPDVQGGPPHFVNGMYAEIIVDDA